MENTTPHPTPRHRSVRHSPALAIAPVRGPRAHGRRGLVERGARGPQRTPRTGHGPLTGSQDGGRGPAQGRTCHRGPRDGRVSRS